MNAVLIAVFLGGAVTVGLIAFALAGSGGAKARLRKRALNIKTRGGGKGNGQASAAVAAPTSLKRSQARQVPLVEELVKRYLPKQSALRERLVRTGFEISIGSYASGCAGLGLVVFLVITVLSQLPIMAALAIGIAVGTMVPHVVVGILGARRRGKFLAVLPDAIDLMVRGLKSGLPVTESIAAVGREMPPPLGTEFQKVSDAVRFGQSLEEVLWEMANRMSSPEFNFFVISLAIQRETGGNLAETLANLSEILRKRKQLRLKINALSSEAKVSAYVVGAMPFVLFAALHAMNPEYAAVLYTDPRGQMMSALAFGLVAVGFGIMTKMVRFKI
jgi:tight adherence protein B